MTEDQEIAHAVVKQGWQAIDIYDTDPPFMYTVGLSKTYEHPEAITFGMQSSTSHRLLSDFVQGLRKGLRFDRTGVSNDKVFASTVGFRVVHESQHPLYLGYAMGFCRISNIPLQAMQVFWPDSQGRFPFDANCEEECYRLQPRLDVALTAAESEEYRWMDDI